MLKSSFLPKFSSFINALTSRTFNKKKGGSKTFEVFEGMHKFLDIIIIINIKRSFIYCHVALVLSAH